MRPASQRVALAASLAAGAFAVAGASAGAASSVQHGWWSQAGGGPIAPAPDAPADGMVVQGSPDPATPLAYAAISYTLDMGETVESITLKVAPDTASTQGAKLQACALTKTFQPAQGGAASEGPSFDCATNAAGEASSDNTSYVFRVGALAREGQLSVAIVPTQANDRVVFEKPGTDSLQSTPGSSDFSSGDSFSDSSSFDSSTSDFGTDSSASIDTSMPSATSFDVAPAPAVDSPAAATSSSSSTGGSGSGRDQTAFAGESISSGSDDDSSVPVLVFGGLALAAAGLWAFAGSASAARMRGVEAES